MPNDKLEQALLARNPDSPKPPPTPDIFLPDPPAVGGKDFARAVQAVLKDFPGIKRGIPKIVHGPTYGSMYQMQMSKLPVEKFAGTNLLGVTDMTPNSPNFKEIGINPDVQGDELLEVLAHELAHTEGAGELSARITQKMYADAIKQRKQGAPTDVQGDRDALKTILQELTGKK